MSNLLPVVRRTKRVTQRDLAKALDISPSYLCKIEKGFIMPDDNFKNSCAAILGEPVAIIFPCENPADSETVNSLFLNNLWAVRNKKNIRQNKMAEMLGCSPSYLSRIENGTQCPSEVFKKKCARILKTKASELFPDIKPVIL